MNSIAAFMMVQAIDNERRASVERRRQAKSQHAGSADVDAPFAGGQSWRSILRFPRFTTAASKS
jgi:hypothetical protein